VHVSFLSWRSPRPFGNTTMTEASTLNPQPRPIATGEDLTLPIVIYVLYLVALPTAFLSLLVGVIMAYINRDTAGPAARSHYTFIIRTFWLSLAIIFGGTMVCVIGGILSLILIGIPILLGGIALLCLGKVWYIVRCILGIAAAARHEAYPRPDGVLF
jgi:uncharacterized membrane protein